MIPVLRSLASLAILLVLVQGQPCRQRGKFGPKCAYDCHCSGSVQCNQNTGRCPGQCLPPWSGPSCQRENVAYRKKANSSGSFETNSMWTADKTVDGNTNQSLVEDSCYVSNRNVSSRRGSNRAGEAWLTLDLGRPYHTRHMTVFGRAREFSPARLNNTRLFVSNKSSDRVNPCYTFSGGYSRGFNIVDLTCDREGRYVTLYDNDVPPGDPDPSAFMEICEIEVYVCSQGRFGEDCEGESHYQNDYCDHVTVGKGCQGICAAGFLGNTCSSGCQETQFGENCASTCHCRSPGCDVINGTCHEPGCLDGYDGHHCNSDVDECDQPEDVCGEETFCVNIPGSFFCVPLNQSTEIECSSTLVYQNGSSQVLQPSVVGGSIAGGAGALLLLEIGVFACCYRRRQKRPKKVSTPVAKSVPKGEPEGDNDSMYISLEPENL